MSLSSDSSFDVILVDVLEDVRRIDKDTYSTPDGDCHEDIQLQPVNHHRNIPPVFENLQRHKCIERF